MSDDEESQQDSIFVVELMIRHLFNGLWLPSFRIEGEEGEWIPFEGVPELDTAAQALAWCADMINASPLYDQEGQMRLWDKWVLNLETGAVHNITALLTDPEDEDKLA